MRRNLTKEAIALALQSRWEEAVAVNRGIIALAPTDVDAYNRLGKALTELGRYAEARAAYRKALELSPVNSIAQKNLQRLAQLQEMKAPKDETKVAPHLFIEETGKTGFSYLHNGAPAEVLALMAAGDQVDLVPQGQKLIVENAAGRYLGEVEPRLGLRLIKMMERGNRYAAAVASAGPGVIKIIIKEIYQHPSSAGRFSFPPQATEVFRPYIKEVVLKYGLEEEEAPEEKEETPAWEREEVELAHPGVSLLSEEERIEEAGQEEEEELD